MRAQQHIDPISSILDSLRQGNNATAENEQRCEEQFQRFLDLSAELRNMVYGYYFSSDLRIEFATSDVPSFTTRNTSAPRPLFEGYESVLQKLNEPDRPGAYDKTGDHEEPKKPTVLRVTRKLGYYNIIAGMRTKWGTSVSALIFVCKQVNKEAIKFLYQNPLFAFHSPNRLHNFLGVTPRVNTEAITRLHLHYETHGNLQYDGYRDNGPPSERYHAAWVDACKSASEMLKNLEELEFIVALYTPSVRLHLNEKWVEPMLQFRRLACPPGKHYNLGPEITPDLTKYKLRIVKINIQPTDGWEYEGINELRAVSRASKDLHRLFGQSIAKAILWSSEEEAMADFMNVWNGKHKKWQRYLDYV